MKIIAILLCLISSTTFADDGYLKIMAQEIVSSFQFAVDDYNKNKSAELPTIKHDKDNNYYFNVSKHLIEFSVADYLQGRIILDKKLKKLPSLSENKKTVYILHYLINEAQADDQTDVEPTRIMLATLGRLDKSLQEVSYTCLAKDALVPFGMSTCKKDNTKANMEKLKRAIGNRQSACDNIADEQVKIPNSDLYTVKAETENDFKQVKELIVKISESRSKKVNDFFKSYMSSEDQKHQSCVDVVTNGTVVDYRGSSRKIGAINVNDVKLSPEKEEMKAAAIQLCKSIEELRACLIKVGETYNGVVHSNRTNSKAELPSVEAQLNGNAVSK